jgi:hypothetical protein
VRNFKRRTSPSDGGWGCGDVIPVKDKSTVYLLRALEEIERVAKNSDHSRWQRDLIAIEHLARDARQGTRAEEKR